jgi:hydrogenase nickel incorporation protein HypB
MKDPLKIIELKESVYADNNQKAEELRKRLKLEKTFLLNLMASPGAGKTTLFLRTVEKLKGALRIGVMEADIDSSMDAQTIAATGVKAIQLHTGGMCHLDAGMTEQGIDEFGTRELDLVVLENVGNLVCPAEFDTGAARNAMILSVPEGDDKPLKYPLMFSVVDALVVNKIDCLPYFDFDVGAMRQRTQKLNPEIEIFEVSAKTGEGIDAWAAWLKKNVEHWNR